MEKMEVEEDSRGNDYTSFPQHSVKALAKSIGYPGLDDNVAAIITQDIDYKITTVMQCARQFMKHCGRNKLTTCDVSRALSCSDVPPVYGHSSILPPTYIHDEHKDAFYIEDSEVDLFELATTVEEYEPAASPSLSFQWITGAANELKEYEDAPSTSQAEEQRFLVSKELLTYYDLVTKSVLDSSPSLLKIALVDLRSNSKISPLLPFFVNFIHASIKDSDYDVCKLNNLLRMMDAVIQNPNFNLSCSLHLSLLSEALLQCIKKPFPESVTLDDSHLELQQYAAHLLSKVLKECLPSATDTYEQYISSLNDIISAIEGHPLSTHLGAVTAIISCGPNVICRILYPRMNHYVACLSKILENTSTRTAQKRDAAQQIFHYLLNAAEIMLRYYSEPNEVESLQNYADSVLSSMAAENNCLPTDEDDRYINSSGNLFAELYKEFYNYFGDSLIARLPSVYVEHVHLRNCIPPLFPKSSQKGFEMLDDIYKRKIPESNASKGSSNATYSIDATNPSSSNGNSDNIKLVIRKVTQRPNSPKTKKKGASKNRDNQTSWETQFIEKDSSSNSGDLSLTKSAISVSNKDLVPIKCTSKTMVYRKLTTGNINYIL